jgi:SAM-dependent methyltransferase
MSDFKKSARDYVKNLDKRRIHHLYVKPFCGGPDYTEFFGLMYGFLNLVQVLSLKESDRILDVGCGPGWATEYLAMLGYRVVGIDICGDMVKIAQERISTRKYPVYLKRPLDYEFRVHDIEAEPFRAGTFNAVLLLSSLHHLEDPEKALHHLFEYNLGSGGRLAISEGIKPPPGTPWEKKLNEVMEQRGTLERPFNHEELSGCYMRPDIRESSPTGQSMVYFNPMRWSSKKSSRP